MLKSAFVSIMTGALLTLMSCTNGTTEVSFTLEKTYTIHDASLTEIDVDQECDATNNADFLKYQNSVVTLSLESVTYTITRNAGPSGQTVGGSFTVLDANDANEVVIASISNLNINDNLNKEQVLVLASDGKSKCEGFFKTTPHKAHLKIKANVSQVPCDFDVHVVLHIRFTYNK